MEAISPPPSVALTISPARLISIGASCTFSSPHSRPYVFRIMGARASRCSFAVDGSNHTPTQLPLWFVPHSSPRSPVNQYLAPARFVLPECPSRTLTAMLNSQCGCSACRSEEHTSELQSHLNLVCRLLLEKKKTNHRRR